MTAWLIAAAIISALVPYLNAADNIAHIDVEALTSKALEACKNENYRACVDLISQLKAYYPNNPNVWQR